MTSANFQPVTNFDITATVADSATTSAEIDLHGCELVGLFTDSAFDGTTITFTTTTASGGTYVPVQDGNGNTFTITTAASKYAPLNNLAILAGLRFVKIVTGTTQTGASVFTLATRPI